MTLRSDDPPARIPPGRSVLLCADDYAISESVSAGIEDLVAAGKLSATTALVTFPEWPVLAQRLAALRGRIAIGLHLNLTVGAPLVPMPKLAPSGELPPILDLMTRSMRGAVDAGEIEAETFRQLTHFSERVGHAPDFLDGHQHAHALPGLRAGVLAGLRRFAGDRSILVRYPADTLVRIMKRRVYALKALKLSWLTTGFGPAARRAGQLVNDGFSGVSEYDSRQSFARELEAGFGASGPRHLMMCHPGHTDGVLAKRDRVTTRREQEFDALMAASGMAERLWRPDRGQLDIWRAWRA